MRLAAKRTGPDRAFDGAVIHLDATIVQQSGEALPAGEGVATGNLRQPRLEPAPEEVHVPPLMLAAGNTPCQRTTRGNDCESPEKTPTDRKVLESRVGQHSGSGRNGGNLRTRCADTPT